jgi:protein mago nashi
LAAKFLVYVNEIILQQLLKIIVDSGVLKEDDKKWPKPNSVGSQELELTIEGVNKTFHAAKFGSFGEV